VPPDGQRAVDRAIQHRPHDRVEAVGRQFLGEDQKIAGRVVDDSIHLTEAFDGVSDERLDLPGIAHVRREEVHCAAFPRRRGDLRRRGLEPLPLPPRDRDLRAERDERPRHRKPEPRSSPRDQNGFS
jgi:hypothetical protein